MSATILTTKLYIPPPPSNLIPRPRLVEKLKNGFDQKITLVSAPAGFGKTTLLSECARGCEYPVAWYSIDENDNELVQFLTYFIAALQMVEPGLGDGASIYLKSQPLPVDVILNSLINEIDASLKKKIILILEDYHLIESQAIDQVITYLLEHMPYKIHLVIAGRIDPTLPLPRLRSLGQLNEIRIDDLRFTRAEAGTFLEYGMGLKISPQDVDTLETRTEGWAAGLQLVGLSMQGFRDQDEINRFVKKFSSSHRYILDYLTDEVLQQRPSGTTDFLLQTSILDRFNASLCGAVTGIENTQEILETLEAVNLFLIPLDHERHWYRYHHLFNDLLHKRLVLLQPEMVPKLHQRAAEWYRRNGWFTEALKHLIAARNYSEAADMVENQARALLEKSELAALMNWVAALPENQVVNRPWLCIYHAWALRLSGAPFNDVESRIESAKVAMKNIHQPQNDGTTIDGSVKFDKPIAPLWGHILALESFQQLYKEDIPTVLEMTQQAQEYEIEESFVKATLAFAHGWAMRFSGDLESSYRSFENTKNYSLASENIYMAVAAWCRAAYGRVLAGELHRAHENFLEAIDLATTKDGLRYPVAGYAFVYIGGIHYEWNDLLPAKDYLTEGIELCEQVGYIMDQVVGLVNLSQVYTALGEWQAAEETVAEALALSKKMKSYIYVRRWVENVQIRQWHAQEAWDKISHWTQTCGMRPDDEIDFNRDLEHCIFARALVYLGCGQPESDYLQEALPLLARLLESVESAAWYGKAIEICILQSIAYQVLGDQQSAVNYLGKALAWAEPEGYFRTFIDEGKSIQKLLVAYRELISRQPGLLKQTNTRYVDKILAEFEKEATVGLCKTRPARAFLEQQPTIEPLSKRELEVLKLLEDGATNQEIASKLVIAVTTAKKHVSNIIGKLGVTNRTQAVARARDLDLIE